MYFDISTTLLQEGDEEHEVARLDVCRHRLQQKEATKNISNVAAVLINLSLAKERVFFLFVVN